MNQRTYHVWWKWFAFHGSLHRIARWFGWQLMTNQPNMHSEEALDDSECLWSQEWNSAVATVSLRSFNQNWYIAHMPQITSSEIDWSFFITNKNLLWEGWTKRAIRTGENYSVWKIHQEWADRRQKRNTLCILVIYWLIFSVPLEEHSWLVQIFSFLVASAKSWCFLCMLYPCRDLSRFVWRCEETWGRTQCCLLSLLQQPASRVFSFKNMQ